jgi:hypothetical protein
MIGSARFAPIIKGGTEIGECFDIPTVWAGRIAHAALPAVVDLTPDVDL